jgi:hypothetical protein
MLKPFLATIAITFFFNSLVAQESNLCDSIKTLYNKTLFEGGKVIKVTENLYLISLAVVPATNSNASTLDRIATVKARRNMLVFLQGSEITSSKTLKTSENTSTDDMSTAENYVEEIKEEAYGFIDGMEELCSWYTEDKSYIKVIYKKIK